MPHEQIMSTLMCVFDNVPLCLRLYTCACVHAFACMLCMHVCVYLVSMQVRALCVCASGECAYMCVSARASGWFAISNITTVFPTFRILFPRGFLYLVAVFWFLILFRECHTFT